MTPYYSDRWLSIYGGDCRAVLAELEPESVDCVVTSPPYWGLRDYGIEPTVWGGDPDHAHEWGPAIPHDPQHRYTPEQSGKQARYVAGGAVPAERGSCCSCGAWLGVLGLEPTPSLYVAHLVEVFRAIRRVLKPTGTAWLNLGDSYAGSWGAQGHRETPAAISRNQIRNHPKRASRTGSIRESGLKPKDRIGVPHRAVFALQDDGWWWRDEIVWSKPNAMPESVQDRTTSAHEFVFLLTRSARYAYDADAVREPLTSGPSDLRKIAEAKDRIGGKHKTLEDRLSKASSSTRIGRKRSVGSLEGRNLRSVWTIPTVAYPGAHYAVFPPELARRCIAAGAPPAGRRCDCEEAILTPLGDRAGPDPTPKVGRRGLSRPRDDDQGVRLITRREQRGYAAQLTESPFRAAMAAEAGDAFAHYLRTDRSGARPIPPILLASWRERGWLVDVAPCDHPIAAPGVVLDPFGGSGTTGLVAQALGRRAILVDLNPEYLEQQLERASREWGVGGRRLRDRPAEPPPDSLWAAAAEEVS